MKVKELINELNKYLEDMEVTIWADHGQHDFRTICVTQVYIHKDDYETYMMDSVEESWLEEEDKDDYIVCCQIS